MIAIIKMAIMTSRNGFGMIVGAIEPVLIVGILGLEVGVGVGFTSLFKVK